MTKHTLQALVGLGLAATLGACVTPPAPPPGPPLATEADRHRIEVLQTGERLDVAIAAQDMGLSAEMRANLTAFGAAYRAEGHGPLMMSAPSGGENADAAARAAQEARLVLASAGVPYAAIAASAYDASGTATAPLVLSFTRYEAVAPECAPLWEQDLSENLHAPYESFGCAMNANLAAMIEDPHDLIAPRAETPRDASRRATVLDNYRQGAPTGATRSADEQAQISTAIQ